MTRILVVGDTHTHTWEQVPEALRTLVRSADIAIHCGDWVHLDTVEGFRREARQAVVVHGNSDPVELRKALPYREFIEVDSVRIGVTHPAWGTIEPELHELLPDFPPEAFGSLDVLAYGHIHVPLSEVSDGVHFINGGQGYPSFRVPGTVGWIETSPGGPRGRGTFRAWTEVFAPAR